MKPDRFEAILEAEFSRLREVLVDKSAEYAVATDQLANIRFAARTQGISMPEAVRGMMVKHTYSVYSMIADGAPHPIEKWDEKIGDHIIWLILLKAALIEGAENPLQEQLSC